MSDKKGIVSASPKVRKLAREFGADIYQIQGSQREGRVSEEDLKSFIKDSISGKSVKKQTVVSEEYDHSEFGEVDKEHIVTYTLSALAKEQLIPSKYAEKAMKKYNIDKYKPIPTEL